MSERLKSQYLRKREEISSHPGRYFFAGFIFSFFLLFLFYQFRSMILHPTSACEDGVTSQETEESIPSISNKYINYSSVVSEIEINQKDIKENQLDADKLISNDRPKKQARKSTGSSVDPENKGFYATRDTNSKEMTGRKEELN